MPPRLVVHDSGGEDEDDDSILALAGNETTALCGDLSALPSQPMAQAEASTDSTEPLARPIILNAAAPQTSHSATPRIVSGRSSIMAMALYQQGDAGIMTNDSLASSGKGHSDPASLTSQALRAELASAHAALLADIGTPSLLTSSSSSGLLMGQSIADSNSDAVRSLMVEPAPAASSGLEISYISTGDGISADIPSTTHLLSPPTAPTPDETSPAKGDSSTCRSGEKSRESGHNNEEHGKDIWEFDAFSQDPDVQGDDKNEKRRRDDTSYISDIHKG
ncbi:hypothetical protein BDZ91DRAFT_270030 [Kalaharituber pfeilii]|nr:hypothetical protein BDZ91DRAFT_270030 [Kalaharituber pfeilii]